MFKKAALASTALTFFLLSSGPAAAGPLIGAVIGVFSAVASGAGIANAIVSLALAAGTTLLQMATTPDKPPPVGMKIQADVGDDQPVSTTIGQFATRGKRKYIGTWGKAGDTPNAYLTEVFELGSLPVPGLAGLWVNGEKCKILWDEPETDHNGVGYPIEQFRVTEDEGNIVDFAWIKFHDGLQTAADPFLLAKFAGDEERPWDATMVGRGIPYAIMTYRWKRGFFKGQPKILFEPEFLPLYDVRKDSSAGGNGSHRWNDASTHEPSQNLSVMTYNVIRGLRYKGEWFYGGQDVNERRMPAANWIAAHQEAGRLIERVDGSTEPQWRGGYEITGEMTPLDVVEELRKAQNGRLTDQGGVFKMKNGIFGASVFNFDDGDTLVTEPSGFDPFTTVDQTINGINAKYPNPKEAWVAKDAPVLRNAAYEAADGKRNLADISFGATSNDRQVQQLMRGILAEARRFRRHQITLPPMAYVLEAGIDVVGWTSAHNGYVNKRFLVTERRGQMGMNQLVTLQEIDPTDYDWVRDMHQVVSNGWIGRITTPVQPMTGWQAEPYEILDASGLARRPGILIRCAANMTDVKRVRVQVRKASSGALVFDSDQYAYSAPWQWVVSGSLLPNTDYLVRGKLTPFSARDTEWSGQLAVRTPNARFSAEDLHLAEVTKAVKAELAELQEEVWKDTNVRQLIEDRKALARGLAVQDLANFADKQRLRREVSSTTRTMRADYEEKIFVATSATGAVAQRVETLEIKVNTFPAASVINTSLVNVERLGTRYEALAADMTTVKTRLDDKIGSEVFQSLVSETSRINGVVTLQGDIINEINLELDSKASFQGLNLLSGKVTEQGNLITSQGEAITGIRSNVGSAIAESRMRFSTVNAGGTGYALAALQTRFGTEEDFRSAGFFIKTYSDPNKPPEVLVNAGLFAVVSGNDENGTKIFLVDSGGLYIDAGRIRNLKVNQINFDDGTLLASAMPHNGIIEMPQASAVNQVTHSAGETQLLQMTIGKVPTDGAMIFGDARIRCTGLAEGAIMNVTIELRVGSLVIGEGSATFLESGISKMVNMQGTIVSGDGPQIVRMVIYKDRVGDVLITRRTMAGIRGKKGAVL